MKMTEFQNIGLQQLQDAKSYHIDQKLNLWNLQVIQQ